MIDIQLDQPVIAVGHTLSGTIAWRSDRDGVPKSVTISMDWYTEGRGTRDRQTVNEISLDPNHLVTSQGDLIPFEFDIPSHGPITYNGKLIRVMWAIKVLIRRPGILARNHEQHALFQVIPQHLG